MKHFARGFFVTLLTFGLLAVSIPAVRVRAQQTLNSFNATSGYALNGTTFVSAVAPTIVGTSCFTSGTATTMVANGTAAIQLTVGGTPANTCQITFPFSTTGWTCLCTDITSNTTTIDKCKQTASTTSTCTISMFSDVSVASAPAASDKVLVTAFAF